MFERKLISDMEIISTVLRERPFLIVLKVSAIQMSVTNKLSYRKFNCHKQKRAYIASY